MTNDTSSEAREFVISMGIGGRVGFAKPCTGQDKKEIEDALREVEDSFHVIEYRAYEALKYHADEMATQIFKIEKLLIELKEKWLEETK